MQQETERYANFRSHKYSKNVTGIRIKYLIPTELDTYSRILCGHRLKVEEKHKQRLTKKKKILKPYHFNNIKHLINLNISRYISYYISYFGLVLFNIKKSLN